MQLLSEVEAAAQAEAEREKSAHGGSVWNHVSRCACEREKRGLHEIACDTTPASVAQAGTFEEKNMSKWGKERLTEMLKGFSSTGATTLSPSFLNLQSYSNVAGVSVSEVTSISGDANIWLVRGKKRCEGPRGEAGLAGLVAAVFVALQI